VSSGARDGNNTGVLFSGAGGGNITGVPFRGTACAGISVAKSALVMRASALLLPWSASNQNSLRAF